MDWNAIPYVAEILGYQDLEILIAQLSAIRDYHNKE